MKELAGKIKVRVNEDALGSLIVTPVDKDVCELVSASNQYDGSYSLYIQYDYAIAEFLVNYPEARYRTRDGEYKIGRYHYAINDDATFYIDSWEYRHMVGGQSD